MPKLTKRLIDAAKPAAKPKFIWDQALPGFGLLVNPTGKKVYVAQYRNAAGRTCPSRKLMPVRVGPWGQGR